MSGIDYVHEYLDWICHRDSDEGVNGVPVSLLKKAHLTLKPTRQKNEVHHAYHRRTSNRIR
jgi:hypothetical protein